jgi:hypothetical protein
MRHRVVPVLAASAGLAAILAFAAAGLAQQPQPQEGGQQEEVNRADLPPQPFAPQLAALMHLLIQPRHAKLGLAGKAENWILAGFYYQELKKSFDVVGREVPRYKGLPTADLFDAAMKQPFQIIDFAIKAGDARQFNESYGKITAGCNACHATAGSPFIVIKVPEASSYPNQEFNPR